MIILIFFFFKINTTKTYKFYQRIVNSHLDSGGTSSGLDVEELKLLLGYNNKCLKGIIVYRFSLYLF